MERPSGPYPTLVTQERTGRTVPVVQAYAYTKYLGYFQMEFDENGEMLSWNGAPRILNSTIPEGKPAKQH